MRHACRVIAGCCLLASLSAAQEATTRKIVLPNPQLIHCRSAECSQLWKNNSGDSPAVYPAQVCTDVVKGEVVGLTAVYDKSVSQAQIRAAIDNVYGKWARLRGGPVWVWRVESENLAVSIYDGTDGATQITYLKFGTFQSLVPSAHIEFKK
jgi:hypothetical protein